MPPSAAPIPPPVPAARPHRIWLAALIAAAVIAALFVLNPGSAYPPVRARGRQGSIARRSAGQLLGDPREDYFADGMTEELITDLSKISNLRVTSRTSVMGLKNTKKKIPELARDMGVNFVVEGSVVRDGSKVRVTAQLIDGTSDKHVWADSFQRDVKTSLRFRVRSPRQSPGRLARG